MKEYISKTNVLVNLFFQIIFWIIILCISVALFRAPFKTGYFLKNPNTINQDNFYELIPIFISDFIGLILFLLMGGIYYHFSSNSLENFKTVLSHDFNKLLYELKNILKKYSLITILNCIFLFLIDQVFILVLLNITLIFLVLKCRFIPIRGYCYIIFGSISFLIFIECSHDFYLIFLYLLIILPFNFFIYHDSPKGKKSYYFITFLISFCLSIFTNIFTIDINYTDIKMILNLLLLTIFFSLQFTPFIYIILYLFKITLSYLKKLPVAEYTAASFAKQNRANKAILNFLYKQCEPFKKIPHKKIEEVLNISNLSLDKKKSFGEFIFKLNLSEKDTNKILNFYSVTPLPYEEIKNSKTENVKYRNNNNLLISIGILIVLIIFYFISLVLFGIDFTKLFLKISFLFIFIRLLLRSIEICFAFYNDIKPNVKIKRTNLSGAERIALALKSIMEVIILSTTLYLINDVKTFPELNFNIFYEFFNLLIESFFKATAIAFFNISFEYTGVNIFSIKSLIAITHLLQIISSVTLISISIANYINLPKQNVDYELIISKDKFYLYKKIRSTNSYSPKELKKVADGISIDELLTDINNLWNNDKINFLELEEIHEFLNIVYFKL
ncbi:hypothetical protein [Lysinibacillus xylanilyticus]|uniref:hypothetical protein n=1 Tax=Lysinibacillus xylanilyticus TaxID=582475 RepID=UPI003CFDC3F1